ncbi:glycosyltransferase family 2 protein [Pseudarthrobacter sp. S9]|uniref:glycosyltransferase family 2 protein n=1 Tax=Pseudarthrobacter sp. S9 TaxID=3418421 RepID=UPI003D018302
MIREFQMGIDVVVVSFNSAAYLPRLAKCLRNSSVISTVTIVDNGSADETIAVAKQEDWGRDATIILRGSNPGFGSSMNVGVFQQEDPHSQILILNPDVDIAEHTLEALSSHLHRDAGLGTVGPVLRRSTGTPVSSARSFPTPHSIARRYNVDANPNGVLTRVDWICGASMLWRRDAFEQLGGFSEEFFLYFEDIDICRRALDAGWTVAIDGASVAVHDQGHGVKTSSFLRRQSRISRRKYARKWLGTPGLLAATLADVTDGAADIYHAARGI